MFHCFGCGASGNATSFLMDFNHLDFVEAVEDLAAFVGVDVSREAANTPLNLINKIPASYTLFWSKLPLCMCSNFALMTKVKKPLIILKTEALAVKPRVILCWATRLFAGVI
jgi:hypothetical protein